MNALLAIITTTSAAEAVKLFTSGVTLAITLFTATKVASRGGKRR